MPNSADDSTLPALRCRPPGPRVLTALDDRVGRASPERIADPKLTEEFIGSLPPVEVVSGRDVSRSAVSAKDVPGDAVARTPARSGRVGRSRRRRIRRLLWAMIACTGVLIGLIGGTLGWVYFRIATRPTISIADGVLTAKGAEVTPTEDLPQILDFLEPSSVGTSSPPVSATTIPFDQLGEVSTAVSDTGDGASAAGAVPTTTRVFATLATTPLEVAPVIDDGTSAVLADDDGGPAITIPESGRATGTLPAPRINQGLNQPPLPGEAINILISGQDSRANVDATGGDRFGKSQVSGNRCDTIMIARIDSGSGRTELLSFPRDLYLEIAETKRVDRINSACAGGPERLIKTIQGNFGIPIHHYVTIDFAGFERIVGAMGGVDICFKQPARDPVTGLNQSAGCNRLTPIQSTAFVRSRRYQEQTPDGKWKADPSGDIGRTTRQQRFVGAVMTQALARAKSDPLAANAILDTGLHAVRTDDRLGAADLIDLASRFQNFDPSTMPTFTVNGRPEKRSGKAVLIVDSRARAVVDRFR